MAQCAFGGCRERDDLQAIVNTTTGNEHHYCAEHRPEGDLWREA